MSGRKRLAEAAPAVPHAPGVYLFLGEDGEVLYVGKAGDLRKRIQQHAKAGPATSHLHGRYELVRDLMWEVTVDEQSAAWREADLIFAIAPPYNAGVVRRDPRFLVVRSDDTETSFSLEDAPGARSYGCFPHLGKGVATQLGIACSDGYVAFLRLLWAASGAGTHTPSGITNSAPDQCELAVDPRHHRALHSFLGGVSPRLVDDLRTAARDRPEYMQPALARDADAAIQFFAAGPRAVRAFRLRDNLPVGPIPADAYRAAVLATLPR